MDIIIGREKSPTGQKAGRLKLTVNGKSACVGAFESVNKYVSGEHCTLTINPDGSMLLKNLNMQNVTYVNGQQVNSKRVTFADTVILGGGGYVPWDEIKKLLPKQVDVRHLEKVYDDYNEQMDKLEEEQSRRNKIKAVTGVLSTIAIAASLVLGSIGGGLNESKLVILIPIYAIIIFANVYYALKDDIPKKRRELKKAFEDQCVCQCGYPLNYTSYKRIPAKCPGCGSQLIK